MRIQKYLSEQGILSRREAEDAIRARKIKLNGKIVETMGVQMDPSKDRIEVESVAKGKEEKKITIAINKPRGIVSSKNPTEGRTVFQAFPQFAELNAVGRLDKESEGLLLLSNDGAVTAAVTGPDHAVEKEYIVTVREEVGKWHMKKMSEGILLSGVQTLPAEAELLSSHSFSLIIREGKTHQIRRMADALHLTIVRLLRVRIGNIRLKNLSSGKTKILTEKEVSTLKNFRVHQKKETSYAHANR